VIALLGPALAAHAAPPLDTEALARRHFVRGKQLFDEHKYREAAEEFEAGYAVAAKPGFLLNIAHSYRRAGELRKARRYYELFLEKDKASPQRAEVQGYIKAIDEALAGEQKPAAEARPPAPAAPAPAPEPPRPAPPVQPRAVIEVKPLPLPAPTAEPEAPEPLHVVETCQDQAPPPPAPSPRWPWIVGAAAAFVAGGLAVGLVVHYSKSQPCGTIGCFDER
jgi:hypothetical protein